MGGGGVHDTHAKRFAAYAASVYVCWPTLQRVSPALADLHPATASLGLLATAREAYEGLCAARDRVAATYATLDSTFYLSLIHI